MYFYIARSANQTLHVDLQPILGDLTTFRLKARQTRLGGSLMQSLPMTCGRHACGELILCLARQLFTCLSNVLGSLRRTS